MLKNSLLFFRGIPLKPNVFTVKFASMLKAVKTVRKNINNKKLKKTKNNQNRVKKNRNATFSLVLTSLLCLPLD